jgi:hypothetical protein
VGTRTTLGLARVARRQAAGGRTDDRAVSADDNVIDLRDWRAHRRPEEVPGEVLAELDAAARVYETLLAQGHELRFELPEDGGRVRAELRSLDGELVRTVTLAEVLGVTESEPPVA